MPITQALNSKANVKKFTSQDYPINPQQPVISSYYATSTAGQTVINLSFSVDQSLTDQFFLFVDGKKLRLGSGNDYTFTSVAADNTSSQVTLTQSLTVNLNIQAFKLGLKNESEFQTDNRFVTAYDYLDKAFQGFVSQSVLMTATSTTGTPASGTFYSTISNRASIVDFSQDLKPRMGVDPIIAQQVYLIPTEFGSNGESVFGVVNDDKGQIRLVGGWSNSPSGNATYGPHVESTTNTTDYAEFVFYGTGVNILHRGYYGTSVPAYSIDGGSFTNLSTGIDILGSRSLAPYVTTNLASGLTPGVHTVQFKLSTAGNNNIMLYGFQALNESSLVKVNPGVSYIKGQKLTLSSQSTFSYSAPVTGTRGGRVLIYQNSDGSVGTAWQAVDASSLTLTSADHTNEDPVRVFRPREFGAARSDDFSLLTSSARAANFVLDDNTTSLSATSAFMAFSSANYEGLACNSISDYIFFTFVGTGLDVTLFNQGSGTTDGMSVDIDGAGQVTLVTNGSANIGNVPKRYKVASGLPYGQHTVRFIKSAASTTSILIGDFIVYQPKKPTLPSGAVELGEYNVPANYSASTGSAAALPISTGVISKSVIREVFLTGTWGGGVNTSVGSYFPFAQFLTTSTNGDTATLSFFGTGVEVMSGFNSGSCSATIQIDGSAYTGSATATNSTTWTAGTSTWNIGTASNGAKLQITGLSLGFHTIKWTNASGASSVNLIGFNVITPTHSYKSNVYVDLQNTLTVGNSSISDNRKTTPSKDSLPSRKAWAQAVGVTNNPTTSSTAMVPVPDMSCPIKTEQGAIDISFCASVANSVTTSYTQFQIYVDSVAVTPVHYAQTLSGTTGINPMVSLRYIVPVSAGFHKIDVYWSALSSGTVGINNDKRVLTVKEI